MHTGNRWVIGSEEAVTGESKGELSCFTVSSINKFYVLLALLLPLFIIIIIIVIVWYSKSTEYSIRNMKSDAINRITKMFTFELYYIFENYFFRHSSKEDELLPAVMLISNIFWLLYFFTVSG